MGTAFGGVVLIYFLWHLGKWQGMGVTCRKQVCEKYTEMPLAYKFMDMRNCKGDFLFKWVFRTYDSLGHVREVLWRIQCPLTSFQTKQKPVGDNSRFWTHWHLMSYSSILRGNNLGQNRQMQKVCYKDLWRVEGNGYSHKLSLEMVERIEYYNGTWNYI